MDLQCFLERVARRVNERGVKLRDRGERGGEIKPTCRGRSFDGGIEGGLLTGCI